MLLKDLTPQWLVRQHFFGIYLEDPETGEVALPNPQNPSQTIPDSVIQQAIEESIDWLEDTLDVAIRFDEHIVERHDYDMDTFEDFMQVNLRRYPVIRVHSLKLTYGEQGQDLWDVPSDLIQIHGSGSKFGIVNILPMLGISNNYDPYYALLFPGVVKAHRAPSLIRVEYDAGIEGMKDENGKDRRMRQSIIRAVSLRAAIHPLNILGDIVLGAGIASISGSVDGVSTSVNTTSSAENAAYSARIIMHRRELYGEQGVPGLIQTLQKQWRRPGIALL